MNGNRMQGIDPDLNSIDPSEEGSLIQVKGDNSLSSYRNESSKPVIVNEAAATLNSNLKSSMKKVRMVNVPEEDDLRL